MPSPSPIPAVFYRSASGTEPVREWLRSLAPADRQAIGQDLAVVQFGRPVGMPVCRPLGKAFGKCAQTCRAGGQLE